MSSRISLWAGLIGVGATILVQPSIATAKTSVEIGEIAKTISVLINGSNNVGSGVILQQEGDIFTVLTAAHVVKDKVSYKITTSDDRAYQIIPNSIRSAPGNIDLAIFKFKSTTKYPTAKLGNCNILKSGMDLYVAGFPGTSGGITEQVFVFREGKVSANSTKTFDKGYSLVYSNDTLPGMSGGAVLNGEGELVAIHGRGDRKLQNDGTFGAKNGFNLGIPINRFATVASNLGVKLSDRIAPIPQNLALKADDYFVSARQKYDEGDNRGALSDYDRAIALDPKYAYAHYNRGLLKAKKLNDIQGALADYNQAIAINPNYAEAYNSRGALKVNNFRDMRGALADYNQAIALDPKSVYGYIGSGYVKAKLNDIRGALADFNRAIALDPKSADAHNGRGALKEDKLNDIRGALADFNRAIALDPKYAYGFRNRGLLKYQKLNDVTGAFADLTRAIALDPSDAENYYNRGDFFYSAGNRAAAIADFRKVAEIDRSSSQGLIAQGIAQTQQGTYPRAIELFNEAAKISPTSGDIYKYRGQAFKQQGNKAAAIRDWQKAAQSYKTYSQLNDHRVILGWLRSLGTGE
jgi:tetratricopeptide (TPR) repeat protein